MKNKKKKTKKKKNNLIKNMKYIEDVYGHIMTLFVVQSEKRTTDYDSLK